MEKTSYFTLIALVLVLPNFGQVRALENRITGKIGYISGNTIYINVGQDDGITVGDTVDVVRGDALIGKLLVANTATNASSCTPLFPVENARVGDQVVASAVSRADGRENKVPVSEENRRALRKNDLQGRIALGSMLSDDLTSSGLGFTQPSLSALIRVTNIAGKPLHLTLRERTRYYGRDRNLAGEASPDRWTNTIFELSLEYADRGIPYRIEVGRILPSSPRGIGYIDGALVEYRPRELLRFGITGGTRPDPFNGSFRSKETAFGIFAGSEQRIWETGKLSYSTAFVGSYRVGTVDREYLCVEGSCALPNRISTTGSIEIDLNRSWKSTTGSSLELISLYLSGQYRFDDGLSACVSYDTRRLPRTFDTRSVPDSLFDDSLRKGLHGSVSWTLSRRLSVSGNAGIRFRKNVDNTYSTSGAIRVRDFPAPGVTTQARFQFFNSLFSRGYRPTVDLAFSPMKDFHMNMRIGDSIYEIGGHIIHNPLIGSSLNYWMSRRYFTALSFNGYLSGEQKSIQIFAETGMRF